MSAKAKKTRRKPLYVAKSGNVTVAVHSSSSTKANGKVYPGFRLGYKDAKADKEGKADKGAKAKRRQPYYANFDEAKKEADKLARDLALGEHPDQTGGGSLSKEEVADYRRLQNLAANLDGLSVYEFLTRDAVPAYLHLKECGFTSLFEAASYYCRGFKGKLRMTVAQAIDKFLAQKKPTVGTYHFARLRARLKKLRAVHGKKDIRDLDLAEVSTLIMVLAGRIPVPPGYAVGGPRVRGAGSSAPAPATVPVGIASIPLTNLTPKKKLIHAISP